MFWIHSEIPLLCVLDTQWDPTVVCSGYAVRSYCCVLWIRSEILLLCALDTQWDPTVVCSGYTLRSHCYVFLIHSEVLLLCCSCLWGLLHYLPQVIQSLDVNQPLETSPELVALRHQVHEKDQYINHLEVSRRRWSILVRTAQWVEHWPGDQKVMDWISGRCRRISVLRTLSVLALLQCPFHSGM